MKLKIVCRKVYDYVRYDLKEIAFPSSLPDPPHIKKRRKLTWKERLYVLKKACRLYAASWVRDIGPDLRPDDYRKDEGSEVKPDDKNAANDKKEPSTLEDLAVAARGGMETLRPALQRVYMTRASAYRDALKSFIQGYQEGIQQIMAGKEDNQSKRKEDNPPNYGSKGFSSILGTEFKDPKLENVTWIAAASWSLDLQHLLQVCARKGSIEEGKLFHARAIQAGLQTDTLTSNILINMYSKCGLVDAARQVFDRMPQRSIVSWNTMIGAYTQHGKQQEALKLFKQMKNEGTSASEFTLSSILCACAAKLAVCESKQLHAFSLKTSYDSNVFVGTALLDVYAKCNLIEDACMIFDGMQEKTEVTWSSMVAGFVQNYLYEEALILFHQAQNMGLEQTKFTLSAALSACASLAAQIEGTQVHAVLLRKGFGSNLFVTTSLVDMYAKCGSIEDAYSVFSVSKEKSVVLWNAMVTGFSKHARSTEAMILFEKMQQAGMHPNELTYVSLLSACSHAGFVKVGQLYFDLMIRDSRIEPNVHHYSCMVDLLGRSGLIREARELIEGMPFEATASMWGSLLGSCRTHGDLKSAEVAAECLFKIEPSNAGNHVLLSNAYAANKKWEEVVKVRKALKDSRVKKVMGKSWIEIKNQVHTFVVGERSHPKISEIYAKLDDLEKEMQKLEYKADIEYDLHDVGEDQKEELLRHHSEKLALAFGLISLPLGAPIIIKKNLRVCGDCHSVMKFVSKITARVIIVRDTNRFHHFRDGSCSCGDFW